MSKVITVFPGQIKIDNEIYYGLDYDLTDAISNLLEENEQLKSQLQQRDEVIDETIDNIDITIELIKQQPTKNNTWILERLSGFKHILNKYKNVGD